MQKKRMDLRERRGERVRTVVLSPNLAHDRGCCRRLAGLQGAGRECRGGPRDEDALESDSSPFAERRGNLIDVPATDKNCHRHSRPISTGGDGCEQEAVDDEDVRRHYLLKSERRTLSVPRCVVLAICHKCQPVRCTPHRFLDIVCSIVNVSLLGASTPLP